MHSKIDPSELVAKGVLRARRLCCLRRLLSVLSRRCDLQKPNLIEVLSALLRGEAQIVCGVLELAYYRVAGDKPPHLRALPGFRLSSQVIGRCSRLCLVV